ncbi:hypothetical protein [Sulfurimonas sp. CS5]|uniref:hypothetical protein n=1 Tax=Sulfurimonas sp. CS5 TaxID=3391145 RepID=UPI0039E79A8B
MKILCNKLEKYILKQNELLKISVDENDFILRNILKNLTLNRPNLLWDLIDTQLDNESIIMELKCTIQ